MEDVNIVYKKIDGEINPTYKVKLNEIKVPIKKGEKVGTLEVIENDKVIRTVNLTVMEDIEKCNIIELYLKNLKNIVSGNISFN